MKHAKLLDCTLRDGAYLLDKKFGDPVIRGIVEGLVKARVDLIEIGFFQDEGFGEGKTVYRNSADARRFVPDDKQGALFTVLADYSRYSVENLDECTGDSIDAVRECFFKAEREGAVEACRAIKAKGYRLFVQPVDILGYSDLELIELIQKINEVEPYCFSIVDTFGSMYLEDLRRVFELIHHNLAPSCRIGFHSHNNMQLSNALSQEFIRMSYGKREVVVDGTIAGMGRGAGNTLTEAVAQYMVSQLGYSYDIDALLDIIDDYMDNIRARCSWGFTTPYFVAGCYGAHVNNIAYLCQKNSIRSKDIRYILNKIGAQPRKRYDYDLLEKTYLEYLTGEIDDAAALGQLREELAGKPVLLLLPGRTAETQKERIDAWRNEKGAVVISVNFVHESIPSGYVFLSNLRRYSYWRGSPALASCRRIVTSNVKAEAEPGEVLLCFNKLVKCGWEHLDNSGLMALRLLDELGVAEIGIAGMDGYRHAAPNERNFATEALELANVKQDPDALNREIAGMLRDYMATRKSDVPVRFVTDSRFAECLTGQEG